MPIAELARRRDIPLQFLEQLFATLRRAGLLQSQRGVKGGYTFVKDPRELTVLEVVELLDGEVGAEAGRRPRRQEVWTRAVAALREVLAARRSPTSCSRRPQAAGAQMYHI